MKKLLFPLALIATAAFAFASDKKPAEAADSSAMGCCPKAEKSCCAEKKADKGCCPKDAADKKPAEAKK